MSISGPSETLVPETKEGIKKKILIVEDDNSFLLDLKMDDRIWYQVYTATNEQEALEMLKTHNPDLVTLDGNFQKQETGK